VGNFDLAVLRADGLVKAINCRVTKEAIEHSY
jgi:hypothetical protein